MPLLDLRSRFGSDDADFGAGRQEAGNLAFADFSGTDDEYLAVAKFYENGEQEHLFSLAESTENCTSERATDVDGRLSASLSKAYGFIVR